MQERFVTALTTPTGGELCNACLMPSLQNEHSQLEIFLRCNLDIVVAPFNDLDFHTEPFDEGGLIGRVVAVTAMW